MRSSRRFAVAALSFTVAGLSASACGGSTPNKTADLTVEQRLGLEAAQHAGCSSCHGATFAGGIAPTWRGLAGSTVSLEDGTTVTADAAYLTTAIADPGAQLVDGYNIAMPKNDLSAEDIARIVAYIQALG